jgi:hypothetical protein
LGWFAEAGEVSPAVWAAGVRITVKQTGGLVRAGVTSGASRAVSWSLRFRLGGSACR